MKVWIQKILKTFNCKERKWRKWLSWVNNNQKLSSAADDMLSLLPASETTKHQHLRLEQVTDTSQHPLQRRLHESGLRGGIAAKKPLLDHSSGNVYLSLMIFLIWPAMCGSHSEAWRNVNGRALLVSLVAIYSKFKAHLTSVSTAGFCSSFQPIWC